MLETSSPTKFTFTAEKTKDEKWHLVYKEWFESTEEDLTSAKETMKAMEKFHEQAGMGGRIFINEDECYVGFEVLAENKENAFDYLCGELMANSNLGKLTINQLLTGVMLAGSGYLKSRQEGNREKGGT